MEQKWNMNYEAHEWGELNSVVGSLAWSKEDELMVLEKLLEFSTLTLEDDDNNNSNNNRPRKYYSTEFYNYVHKMLSGEAFENQVCYMIYRLRSQYLEHREEQGLDPHALKVLELSRKLWEVEEEELKDHWPKTKLLKDRYEKRLGEYVVEELGLEGGCFPPSVLEAIKQDWRHFQFVEDQIRRMHNAFSLRLFQWKARMHNNNNDDDNNNAHN